MSRNFAFSSTNEASESGTIGPFGLRGNGDPLDEGDFKLEARAEALGVDLAGRTGGEDVLFGDVKEMEGDRDGVDEVAKFIIGRAPHTSRTPSLFRDAEKPWRSLI